MTTIKVFRPDLDERPGAALELAPRGDVPAAASLTVVDNGKPGANALLTRMAEHLRERLALGKVEVYTKASAGKPLAEDETRMLAARSHLVITGLGD